MDGIDQCTVGVHSYNFGSADNHLYEIEKTYHLKNEITFFTQKSLNF